MTSKDEGVSYQFSPPSHCSIDELMNSVQGHVHIFTVEATSFTAVARKDMAASNAECCRVGVLRGPPGPVASQELEQIADELLHSLTSRLKDAMDCELEKSRKMK